MRPGVQAGRDFSESTESRFESVKRTERHHLKENELLTGIGQVMAWGSENSKNLVNALIVVVGASLLLGGLYVYRSNQAADSQVLLADALELFHAKVEETPSDPLGLAPSFVSNQERYEAALESFQSVATEFAGYDAGRQALYYSALCYAGLDDFDSAATALSQVREGDRDLVYYLASNALAAVRVSQEDYAAAADIYRALVEDADTPLPKDHLLFELAKSEEQAGNLDQAKQYYQRVLAEFPDSQLRGDATARSAAIDFRTEASGG